MSVITLEGHDIELSNPDKPFFPAVGVTKGEVVEYYRRVGAVMLPHLQGRPLTLHRFPDGTEGDGFYQKQAPDYFPEWVDRVEVRTEEGSQLQVRCEHLASLVYLADQGNLTFHPWLSRVDRIEQPDRMVFDLDPPEGVDVDELRHAVRTTGTVLDEAGLTWFLQTSGSKGFHLTVPLRPEHHFDDVRGVARALAEEAAGREPELMTTAVRKASRQGRIFVDFLRNAYAQTSVAPYSLRAKPEAPIATPIDRDELGSVEPRTYTIGNIFRRLGQKDDPWADIDRHRQGLPAV